MKRSIVKDKLDGNDIARMIVMGQKPQDKDGNEFVIHQGQIFINKGIEGFVEPNWTVKDFKNKKVKRMKLKH